MNGNRSHLPPEFADRFTQPFTRFLQIEAATGAILLLAVGIALLLSNSPWSSSFSDFWDTPAGLSFGPFDYERSLRHWINDGLMTIFFFVVALELKRELVLGELRTWRAAALSLSAAIGGMLVPAAIYLAMMWGHPEAQGWGVVMATDTAFVIGCLAMLGSRIQPSLRLFLLSLAIFDDVGAILVVALGYGHGLSWQALALASLGLAGVATSARVGIRSLPVYFTFGGLIWLAFDASGVHPTIAGVILGLMTPTRGWVSDDRLHSILERVLSYPRGNSWSGNTTARRVLSRARIAATEAISPVERLELMLHPWAGFVIMPLFALANAGFTISIEDIIHPVSIAILAGLAIGKPLGVIVFSCLAVRIGLAAKPPELGWSMVGAGALLTGIGFTMSLFIAGLAYEPQVKDVATIGIFAASAISAGMGFLALIWLTSGKPGGETES